MDKDSSGPAFPAQPIYRYPDGTETVQSQNGMTLRDYFAAKAMQGLCAGLVKGDNVEAIPSFAYAMADAMLAERKK